MKKVISLFLTVIMLCSVLAGCNTSGDGETGENSIVTLSAEEMQELIDTTFSSQFSDVEELDQPLTDDEMKDIISKVPTDKYEAYPELQNVPLTATLYKNGETISIDVKDPRLIGLINLYNNAVFHNKYAYSQGLLDWEYLEEVLDEDFRLVLTYTPHKIKSEYLFDYTLKYDTFIITNEDFTLIAHDFSGYQNADGSTMEGYPPYMVYLHVPLYEDYRWLDLFGF